MECSFPAMLILWLGREFYRGKYEVAGRDQAWTPDLGDHFGDFSDKSKIPENAIIFSISLLGEEIYRIYWMFPCDAVTSRTRVYKRRQLKGRSSSELRRMTLEFRQQCELESR
ncbi:hypothetical protein AVEN_265394-1 [Araneus ventricosus]|uniref:Uncharacterized protein n=1 Tax=Araneus ventricosus TaxID=182803 RepID=A0A4Y2HQX8_ARAVE|nr:hypothetical protein AVEN_265394-1 [Araneus ventricosus]